MPSQSLILTRLRQGAGTFGRLTGGGLTLVTLEERWKHNARSISCIPAGTYPLHRTIYHKHGIETFEVTGVPDRSRILLHPGNTEEDTEGCILVGLREGVLRVARDEETGQAGVAKEGIVSSREAFAQLLQLLAGSDQHLLTIVWSHGLPTPELSA